MDNLAAVITAIGGIIATVAGLLIALKKPREDGNEEKANASAVAVTNFERTTVRVDALWDTIQDLIQEITKLKEDKMRQQDDIDRLTRDLESEKRRHSETQKKLDELITEHNKTLKLLAEKEDLIKKLMGEETNGKSTK